MAEVVYLLCAVTSVLCAALLVRGYRQSHAGLLLWASLGFLGLALNNVLLFVDLVVVTEVDLSAFRNFAALVAMVVLVFGLVWNNR